MNEAFVIEILTFFYPQSPPTSVNDALTNTAAKVLHAALEKSNALDAVPRPPSVPGPVWLVSQAVRSFWRSRGKQAIYETARVAAALQYRTDYELARAGI